MGEGHRHALSRRGFLAGAAGAGVVATSWSRAGALSLPEGVLLQTSSSPEGTTLASTIRAVGTLGGDTYLRLADDGPGWPTIVRPELAAPQAGRESRRQAVASFVHLTDVHIIDAQSPGRVEFLDRFGDPYTAAQRPQETLTTHVQASMVERVNALGRGPITGRAFDACVSTGDNIDNQQHNELDWFMGVLNGGEVTANSGDPKRYEGVQAADWEDGFYWRPDAPGSDPYTKKGFPSYPGLLDAAIKPFRSAGLNIPWFSTYGNHDGLLQGNLPRTDAADTILTGSRKITDLPAGTPPLAFIKDMLANAGIVLEGINNGTYPARTVTPDAKRRTMTTAEWVRAHLDHPGRVGPPGHGYTESHLDGQALYYTFEIAPGVLGISLDTGGYNSGSIGQAQLDWLEKTLLGVHSRSFDASGAEVRSGNTDQLVLLFSHFTIGTMNGSLPDPARPDEKRIEGPELVTFLHRFPNIVAWVNGHTHTNTVTAVPDPAGRSAGFWEITTASHVDYPEHARVIEVVDNRDGTISLWCTMLEHAAPAATNPSDLSMLGLASISRELAANNIGVPIVGQLGAPESRNVELVRTAPFDLKAAGVTGAAPAWQAQAATTGTTEFATGRQKGNAESSGAPVALLAGAGVVAAAAAAGTVVALRRRRESVDADDTET